MRPTSVLCVLLVCAALSASHAQVNVTGTGNVGVGSMSGGTINIGPTQAQLEAPLKAAVKASGAERDRLVLKLVDELNAAHAKIAALSSGKPPTDNFNAAIVRRFLATVEGKDVPESDWPRVLNELANRFLETGSRIAAAPVTSDAIKALVASAEVALKTGDFDKADARLEMAEKRAIADAVELKEKWRESNRQAASLLASRGSLALTRLDRRKGAELLQRAFEQRADDVTHVTFWWLIEAADAWVTTGDSTSALQARMRARDIAFAEVMRNPDNIHWQYDLAVSHSRLGAIELTVGNRAAALKSFQADMAIHQALAQVGPSNRRWQQGLSLSHRRIGEIEKAQDNLAAALKSFQTSMAIAEQLAAADPGYGQWQLDLSRGHRMIGDIEQAQGNLAAANQSFEAGLTISARLTRTDPNNSVWQRDLSVNHERIGEIVQAQSNLIPELRSFALATALTSFQLSMAIRQKLAQADPTNTESQRDLSISYERIGDIERAQGNVAAALNSFQTSRAISQGLALADPRNNQWQRDLSVSHRRIGEIEQAQGNLAAALKSFQAAMAIAQKLTAADPGNGGWQRDLSVTHEKIGDIEHAQGNLAAALKSFQAGMANAQKLAAADPGNSDWQLDFVISCWKVGNSKGDFLKSGERRAILVRGLNTLEALEKQGPLAPRAARWPTMFRKAITDLS